MATTKTRRLFRRDVHEAGGIRYDGLKIGPLTLMSLRSVALPEGGPCHFAFLGRLSIARGPFDGITAGLEPGDRWRVLRSAHPSIVLTLAAAEKSDPAACDHSSYVESTNGACRSCDDCGAVWGSSFGWAPGDEHVRGQEQKR
jgi:hypothetical protein